MANFSLAYGCGVAGLRTLLSRARGTRDTEAEARKVYEAWHQFHPQVSRQMQQFDSGTTRFARLQRRDNFVADRWKPNNHFKS